MLQMEVVYTQLHLILIMNDMNNGSAKIVAINSDPRFR